MDYKEKYEMGLEGIQEILGSEEDSIKMSRLQLRLQGIFPELKESEDERIRKGLLYVIEHHPTLPTEEAEEYIAWLEKQGDKVKLKFKVGDWIVYNRDDCSREIIQVYDIRDGRYYFTDNVHFSWSIKECDEKSHLWTIQDAKDGDVLVNKSNGTIGIFQSIGHHLFGGSYNDHSDCFLHCRYDNGFFYANFKSGNTIDTDDLIPAT